MRLRLCSWSDSRGSHLQGSSDKSETFPDLDQRLFCSASFHHHKRLDGPNPRSCYLQQAGPPPTAPGWDVGQDGTQSTLSLSLNIKDSLWKCLVKSSCCNVTAEMRLGRASETGRGVGTTGKELGQVLSRSLLGTFHWRITRKAQLGADQEAAEVTTYPRWPPEPQEVQPVEERVWVGGV